MVTSEQETRQEGPYRFTYRGWVSDLADVLEDPEVRRISRDTFFNPRPGDGGHPKRYVIVTIQEAEPWTLQ